MLIVYKKTLASSWRIHSHYVITTDIIFIYVCAKIHQKFSLCLIVPSYKQMAVTGHSQAHNSFPYFLQTGTSKHA